MATPTVLSAPAHIVPEPVAPLSEKGLAHIMATYRRQAIRGRNYAFGHGWTEDGHKPMIQQPKASAPVPNPEHKPLELLSVNGFRKPLRAFDYRDLNREFWAQGKVVNEDALERNRALELASLKPVESMTLDELIASQDDELMSESRRSWLETGAGILHLDATDYDEGSIGEAVGAELNLEFEIEPTEADRIAQVELESRRYGTAYETLDPITAKQIDWEQRVFHDSEVRTLKIVDGKIKVFDRKKRQTRFETPEQFMAVARRVAAFLLPSAGSDASLERSVTRIDKAAARVLGRKFDRYVSGEIERANYVSGEQDLWASSYETADGLLHHRSLLRSKDEFFHTEQYDPSVVALWNATGSDEEIEDLFGRPECPTDGCFGFLTIIEERSSAVCDSCEEWVNLGEVSYNHGILTETGWHKELLPAREMPPMKMQKVIGFTLQQLGIVRNAGDRAVARFKA